MGQVFGSTDGLDPSGKPLGQNATADQLGLSGGQLFARKALAGGLSGVARGMNTPNIQSRGYSPQIQAPSQPMVDPSYFGVGKPKNPFFGG